MEVLINDIRWNTEASCKKTYFNVRLIQTKEKYGYVEDPRNAKRATLKLET